MITKFIFKTVLFITNIFLLISVLISSQYLKLNEFEADIYKLIPDIQIDKIYLILLLTVLVSSLSTLLLNYFKIDNLFINVLVVNTFSVTLIFIILRIIGFSRFYLLAYVFLFPTIYIFLNKFIEKKLHFIALSFIVLSALCFYLISVNNSKVETNSEIQKNFNEANVQIQDINFVNNGSSVKDQFDNFSTQLTALYNLNDKYILKKFTLCCEDYNFKNSGQPSRQKSIGYLSIYDEFVFYLTGTGEIFYFEVNQVDNSEIDFKFLDSNFRTVNNNEKIYEKGWESTKDILILQNKVYVSFVNEVSENCVNVEIIYAELNFEFLKFKPFFQDSECAVRTDGVDPYPYNGHLAGGKMLYIEKMNSILFSRGDFRNYDRSQNKESLLGKILLINLLDKTYNVVALGTRNPQGLTVTKNNDFILETEHGPNGGDEINLINPNQEFINYGWPIASYGVHWRSDFYDLFPEAPLLKSHKNNGFEEPLIYFNQIAGGHGISDIEPNFFTDENNYFVATLNARRLYEIKFDYDFTSTKSIESYDIGERIRDFEYTFEKNSYIFLLEDSPSIAILKIND